MSQRSLYDDDILLWSEQQAEIIRRLGQSRRDFPNEFDLENVAEEIESVGRSELAAVESQINNMFVHLIKLVAEPQAEAARHWQGELVAFQGEALRRYAPSMRQRIDLDKLWRQARRQCILASDRSDELSAILPLDAPIGLDEMLMEGAAPKLLVEKVQAAGSVRSN